MTYFPIIAEEKSSPAKCPGCGKWFVANPEFQSMSCTVFHGPGTCCHFSEIEVPEPSTGTDK